MKPKSKFTPTNDNDVNRLVEDYIDRQSWEITFINQKNEKYNVEY